ncbi:MAG: hypothetical protein PF443_03620 [Allgaiera sp.]|jgi:Flp pilus assembly protein TadD|nr:hypothetical protein [Allgaiera sp.]
MRFLTFLMVLLLPVAAQACPKGPDKGPARAAVIAAMQKAKSAKEAAGLMGEFWMIQMRAPGPEAQALLNAARAQRDQGDLQGSIDTLTQLIATCPDFVEAYNQRAFSEFLAHQDAASLKDANHVLARVPNHVGALSGKALVLMRMGRVKAAKQTIRAALKLDPWLPERKLLDAPEGQSL